MTASPPPSDLVTLTIDGREVKVPKGTLIVEAAKTVGIEIPVFCYHPKLKPVGACRMCLVEIEKVPRLQTACTSPVAEGNVIHTKNANVIAAQNGVLELLLINHPLDCPICDKGGECPLQDNTFKFGLGVSRFTEAAQELALTQSAVTELVQRAEEAGLVARTPSPSDGRVSELRLTDEGARRLRGVHHALGPERDRLRDLLAAPE